MAEVCSSGNDFLLFPREHSYLETFDPRPGDEFSGLYHTFGAANDMDQLRNGSGQARTSYDGYPPVSAYSSTYFGAVNAPFEAPKGTVGHSLRRNPSSGSPSPSVSQAFDHLSSTLSSASGASAQSTASSADGSPYANATHSLPYQEKWPEPLRGLGIAPEILNGESFSNDRFPSSNFETDLLLEGGKFPHYVGEYRNHFSPSSFPTSFAVVSSISSAPSSQFVAPAFSSPPLALDTTTAVRDITIDSILEEANDRVQNPTHMISPISAASTAASPTSLTDKYQKVLPVDRNPSFRSPMTPASATSRFPSPAASPHASGCDGSQNQTSISLDHMRAQSSPHLSPRRFHPYRRPTHTVPPHGQAHYAKTQNPFFGQSSGRFVAPLESTCWFSLPSPFHYHIPKETKPSFPLSLPFLFFPPLPS